jgi:NAD(P)H-dependent flavin oxidoreductase YrpB (nitropropane dioxygenase family)
MVKRKLKTQLCDMLGIEYPIMCAAMAPNMTDPQLAAAVSEAGGIGVMACTDKTPDEIHDMAKEIRKLTGKPWGMDIGLPARLQAVNFDYKFDFDEAVANSKLPEAYTRLRDDFMTKHGIPHVTDMKKKTPGLGATGCYMLGDDLARAQLDAILDCRPALFVSALGDPSYMVEDAHRRGTKVMGQVGRSRDAARVKGVDALICTGTGAGGHSGWVDGMVLIPHVVNMISVHTPVIAGGGIVDGRGLAGALAMGTIGVWCGTRFIASEECNAKAWYKQAIVNADDMSTVRTDWYTGKPTRHIKSAWDKAWDESGLPNLGMPRQAVIAAPMALGAVEAGVHVETGIMCGQGSVGINSVKSAARIIEDMVEEACDILGQISANVKFSSARMPA